MSLESLFSVIVLYNCSLEESKTIQSLDEALKSLEKTLTLLVFDNSPEQQYAEKRFIYGNFNIIYEHDPSNPGLSKAYNEGFHSASRLEADWILLLDQDTVFNSDFFKYYLRALEDISTNEIVCFIPQVLSYKDNTLLSPSKLCRGGITRPIKGIMPGIIEKPITSINAGTFISSEFVKSIGGFNDAFPLDMLDHWYFREIKIRRKKVLLLDTYIYHDLSVVSFFDNVSISRYENILLSEREFYKDHIIDRIVYKLRLLIRIIKQIIAGEKEYTKLTFKSLIK